MAQELTTIHKITTWVTPGLMLIIGYLLKTDIDFVKDQLKVINTTNIQVTALEGRVNNHEFRLNSLESKSVTGKGPTTARIDNTNVAKHEDIICLSTLIPSK